jgi:hypothetical protein
MDSARGLTAVSSSRESASLGSDAACTADTATARYVAKYDNLMMLCVVYVTSYKETPDAERVSSNIFSQEGDKVLLSFVGSVFDLSQMQVADCVWSLRVG